MSEFDKEESKIAAPGEDPSPDGVKNKEHEVNEATEDTAAAPEGAGNEASEEKKGRTGIKENPDAIPTAGGERLGEKHWGESQMVPDAPPKRDSEGGAGVSSAEGQPDKATQDNTSQNTGGAAPPGSKDDEAKPGFMDKVKDKLNIGGDK